MTENLIDGPGALATATLGTTADSASEVAVDGNLLNSLGLGEVEADPNAIPDGRYDAVVMKSEYVHVKGKDALAHVITYKVTDGDNAGAQVPHWFNLGVNPKFNENGQPISFTPTMTQGNKQWYKKAFVDLGIPEDQVTATPISALVGRECTIGVKKNGQYRNVTYVEARGNALAQAAESQVQAENAANGLSTEVPF